MPVELELLGFPRSRKGGAAQALTFNKPTLLLLYLAYRGDWVSRSEAAFLFRPDDDETAALTQLRLLLHRARSYEWAEALEVTPQQLRFNPPTDVQVLKRAIKEQRWQEAIDLHTAPLLGGYSDPDLPTYSSWLELERASLQNLYESALLSQAQTLEAGGDFASASEVLHKLLGCDPLAETVLQAYLRTTYLAGQREKALKAYAEFEQAVRLEFEIEPLAETQTLAQSIRESKPLMAQSPARALAQPSPLPAQSTRFVGRRQELRELMGQLHQPDCRLLTLMGIGGTGKTRLALELAQQVQGSFTDGVRFVPLAALDSAEGVVSSLVQSLGLKLAPSRDPWAQLLDYLSNKRVLLVLDNFEQVMAANGLVAEILQRSQDLKLLVTSRESLKLSGEWLFDVQGLSYPGSGKAQPPESYDAVQLFVNGVKRVAPQLVLEQSDLDTIAQLCRKLEGHPLAIELASSWARIMPIGRIAQELEHGYDLLQTDLADLPERQRNLRAILDKTWASLSEKKRQTLARLSVFAGGCTLEAAEQVTETHFSILLSLVNESLLKRLSSTRFGLHELLKQYLREKLEQNPTATQQAAGQHANFFLHRLEQAQTSYHRLDYSASHLELMQDLDNVRLGLKHAHQHNPQALSAASLNTIYSLFREASLYQELITVLEAVQPRLSPEARTLTKVYLAELLAETGDLQKAAGHLESVADPTSDLNHLHLEFAKATLSFHQGQIENAEQSARKALELAQGLGHSRHVLKARVKLASVYQQTGRTQEAIGLLENDLAQLRTIQPNRDLVAMLVSQGAHYGLLGQLEVGKELLQESMRVARQLNDSYHQVAAATSLLYILNVLGQNQEAARMAEEALELGSFEFSDALRANLSFIYLKLEQPDRAERHLRHLAQHCPDPTFVTISRARLANLCHQRGQHEAAQTELELALRSLEQTQVGPALVTVSMAVFSYGSPVQQQKHKQRLEGLDWSTLSAVDQEKLRGALAQLKTQ